MDTTKIIPKEPEAESVELTKAEKAEIRKQEQMMTDEEKHQQILEQQIEDFDNEDVNDIVVDERAMRIYLRQDETLMNQDMMLGELVKLTS